MTNMATVEDAVSIAARAHRGQTDKAGAPYLLHPLRMMLRMDTEAAMMAAVLHDVVEDTEWTLALWLRQVEPGPTRHRKRSVRSSVHEALPCLAFG